MKTVIHIGPSKTASTSLQAVIPRLGRPYSIKPKWVKPLCRALKMPEILSFDIPQGTIISHEIIGDFDVLPSAVIAERLFKVFGSCVVIMVARDFDERMLSLYNHTLRGPEHKKYGSLDAFKALQEEFYTQRDIGYCVARDVAKLRRAFSKHDFRVIDFNLLKADAQAFLKAFCDACEVAVPATALPHLNDGAAAVVPADSNSA